MRGSLRKLPSGSWEIRLFLGTDDTGKKRYRSKSVKGSKREAERTMRQLIAEIEAGDVESDRSEQLLTVDELLVRWRAANVNDWSPTTARETWISPHIGTVRVNRLTVERLERFYRTLLVEGGKAGRPLSAQSVKKAHSVVRAALSTAVRWQLITTNPALIARTPRAEPHQHRVPDLDTVRCPPWRAGRVGVVRHRRRESPDHVPALGSRWRAGVAGEADQDAHHRRRVGRRGHHGIGRGVAITPGRRLRESRDRPARSRWVGVPLP